MEPRRFAVDDGRPGHHHRDSVGLDTGHRVPAGCRGRGHDERDLRDYTAGLVAEQPDRFGFFVTIAMLHIDESVAEVVRSLEELRTDGVVLLANNAGTYLGPGRPRPPVRRTRCRSAVC
jgi:predicted TIM-barrel fold metal-dependent hydrolase